MSVSRVSEADKRERVEEGRPRYTLTIEVLRDEVPAIMRLRRCLKSMLRAYGIRVRAITEDPDPSAAGPSPPVAQDTDLDAVGNSDSYYL